MTDMVVVPREALKVISRKDASISSAVEVRQWAIQTLASAPPVGEGIREKVAEIIKQKVSGPHFTDPAFAVAMHQDRLIAADEILALLSSGEA